MDWLTERTGKPVIGVLPYLHGLIIDSEDSIGISGSSTAGALNVIVPVLPRITNHNDFDPLRLHPKVNLQFIGPDQAIPPADLIILPGSQSIGADLAWLQAQGWPQAIGNSPSDALLAASSSLPLGLSIRSPSNCKPPLMPSTLPP